MRLLPSVVCVHDCCFDNIQSLSQKMKELSWYQTNPEKFVVYICMQFCLPFEFLCVCVYIYTHLYSYVYENQFEFKTFGVRTFLESEDILAGAHFRADHQSAV